MREPSAPGAQIGESADKDCVLSIHVNTSSGFGHVGFSTKDADGKETFYDFGAASSSVGKKSGCSLTFRAAARALPLAAVTAYAATAALASAATGADMATSAIAIYLANSYAVAAWPTIGRVTKGDAPVVKPDKSFDIPITQGQLKKITDYAATGKTQAYSLTMWNCATYTRMMMKACGVDVPLRFLFNTPGYMARILKNAPDAVQRQTAVPRPLYA
ncbi:MAG: hypothetical protein H6865_08370 [Rhodospirillales bacterium]|nr:hypothetical protein [Alphaproteobacteria bacterium]MCB9987629.1 hypothetical protein [Rhodospirillales bacterium]USO08072.1 MAG: hypothetical protein H6866_02305 [Rhodospirillales bacterium]